METSDIEYRSWKSWLWWTPLILGVIPIWIAWHYRRWFPTGDLAVFIGKPMIRHLEGAPMYQVMFEPGSNGHYGFLVPLHYLSVKLAHWDMRFDALMVVTLALVSAACFLALLRKSEGMTNWRGWTAGFLGVALMLSPQQIMNWMAGIQTCYYVIVASTFLVLLIWESRLGLVTRTFLSALLAFYASFCFPNGVLTWMVIGSLLLLENLDGSAHRRSSWFKAWGLLLALAAIAGFLFFRELNIDLKNSDARPLMARLMADPGAFFKFFIEVLGVPTGMLWSGLAGKEAQVGHAWGAFREFHERSCVIAGLVFFLAFVFLVVWRCRTDGLAWLRAQRTWVVLGLWGAFNAVAISLGRTGASWSSALEVRYVAFTIPLTLAVLVLWSRESTRIQSATWLGLACATFFGWLGAATDGMARAETYNRPLQMTNAAVMFRKVAPVPGWQKLPGIALETPGRSREHYVDLMDQWGWVRLPTLKSLLVTETPLTTSKFARGGIVSAELSSDGKLALKAWAIEQRTNKTVDALAISLVAPGQPETWLGPCMTDYPSRALNRLAHLKSSNERIGWQLDLDAADEPALGEKIQWLRKLAAAGGVVLQAYAINFTTREICLVGSGPLELKP